MTAISRLLFLANLLGTVFLAGCNAFYGPHFAEGEIGDQIVAVDLDSNLARMALDPSVIESSEAKKQYFSLQDSFDRAIDENSMQMLIKNGSADFASILYARNLLNVGDNECWQNRSWQLIQTLGQASTKQRIRNSFERYHLLVVPGWHWRSRPNTGAAMGYPRKILQSLGLQNSLIETDEHGSVAVNANIIADAIEDAKSYQKPIILVSASKGGADAAYAVGKSIANRDVAHLRGWLNIGGVIAGSTLVDYALQDPDHWLKWLGLPADTPIDGMRDLSTEVSSMRLRELRFPQDMAIINYAALAFSSSVSERSRDSYRYLASYAPNDAAALLMEMQVPESPTVLEYGLDHYMRDKRAMQRIIALLVMMMEGSGTCE